MFWPINFNFTFSCRYALVWRLLGSISHHSKHRFQILTLQMTSFLTEGHSIDRPQHAEFELSDCVFANVCIKWICRYNKKLFTIILYFLPVLKPHFQKKKKKRCSLVWILDWTLLYLKKIFLANHSNIFLVYCSMHWWCRLICYGVCVCEWTVCQCHTCTWRDTSRAHMWLGDTREKTFQRGQNNGVFVWMERPACAHRSPFLLLNGWPGPLKQPWPPLVTPKKVNNCGTAR